jgi:hypothetical protein
MIGVSSSISSGLAQRSPETNRPYAAAVPSIVATTAVSAATLSEVAVACIQAGDAT